MLSAEFAAPARRIRRPISTPDIDQLPPGALCTTAQVALVFGFSPVTLKLWRRTGKGPRVTPVEGKPRYKVQDLRAWRDAG